MSAFENGPYLTAAFLCEKVLTEGDRVCSYIRVVDKIVTQVVSPERPSDFPPQVVQLVMVIRLLPGQARGSFPLEIVAELPSGQEGPSQALTIPFSGGPQQGANVHVELNLELDQVGVWWFSVLGGEQRQLMSRIALERQVQWVKRQ